MPVDKEDLPGTIERVGVDGRSNMTKKELAEAIAKRE